MTTQQPHTAAQTEMQQMDSLLDQVLQKTAKAFGEMHLTPHGMEFGNFEGLWRWSGMVLRARMHPKDINTQEAICLTVLKGRSVGIADPFEALWSTAIINGRPTIWGDMPLAICRQHPAWVEEGFAEFYMVDGERWDEAAKGSPPLSALEKPATAAVVASQRRGAKAPQVRSYSVEEAKRAGLWGKDSPWKTYPWRMLKFRARGFCLRDNFPDALKGVGIRELGEEPREATPVLDSIIDPVAAPLNAVNGLVAPNVDDPLLSSARVLGGTHGSAPKVDREAAPNQPRLETGMGDQEAAPSEISDAEKAEIEIRELMAGGDKEAIKQASAMCMAKHLILGNERFKRLADELDTAMGLAGGPKTQTNKTKHGTAKADW